VNVLMADASLQFVSEDVDPSVWQAVSTIGGSESADLP
jgi:hypothetical protein